MLDRRFKLTFFSIISFLFLSCIIWATHGSTASFSSVKPFASTANTDLVTFVYFETESGKDNLRFFIKHALHDAADFIFIINGECSVEIPQLPNVRVIHRENTCLDLGAQKEVLEADHGKLLKSYSRFLWINASIRGPFMPRWTENPCWTDKFFNRLSDKVKMVGITINCHPGWDGFELPPHMQSMVLAFDRKGLEVLLPHLKCYNGWFDAVHEGEVFLSQWIHEAGYQIDAIMTGYTPNGKTSSEYLAVCEGSDVMLENNYAGMTIHPFDTLFVKTNREWEARQQLIIDRLTDWAGETNFSSYNYCTRY